MSSVPRLRITLLLTVLLTACSLDPQPEPPMGDSFEGSGGSGYPSADAAADAGSGKGGQGNSGAAGSAGAEMPPDASVGEDACNGDNCYCGTDEAGCDAACEGDNADADAACDTDSAVDAEIDADPPEGGDTDGALEPDAGP